LDFQSVTILTSNTSSRCAVKV